MDDEEAGQDRKRNAAQRSAVWALAVTTLTSSMCLTVLFPFSALMVRSFHVTDDEAKLGYYAGTVASAFYLGNLFTSGAWGMWSDKYGRKPVVMVGLVANTVCLLLFGFSPSLIWAIIVRFIHGLFSSIQSVSRVMVTELYDDKDQPQGFAVLSTTFGLGLVLGPSLGGYLCEPAEKFPSLFSSWWLFVQFPYLLPCAALSLLSFLCIFFSFFSLPETLGRARAIHKETDRGQVSSSSGTADNVGVVNGQTAAAAAAGSSDDPRTPLLEEAEEKGEAVAVAPRKTLMCIDRDFLNCILERDTVVSTIMYSIVGSSNTAFIEYFSLWVITDWSLGGMGRGSTFVATTMAIFGVIRIIMQMYIYVPFAKYFGPQRSFQITQLVGLVVAAYPLARAVGQGSNVALVVVLLLQIPHSFAQCGLNSVMTLISNSIQDPKFIGSVVGVSHTVQTLLKVFSPTLAASTFAWSISGTPPSSSSASMAALRNSSLCFYLHAALFLLNFVLGFALSPEVNRRKFAVRH